MVGINGYLNFLKVDLTPGPGPYKPRVIVRDELVDISNPLALFEQSVFSTGYGTLDP
jgi:hypothetical protein